MHLAQGQIPHATAAENYAEAAELIAANWLRYVNRGQLETVQLVLEQIAEQMVVAVPRPSPVQRQQEHRS